MLDYILPDFFAEEKARMSLEPLVQEGAQHGAICHSRSCSPTTGFQNPAFRTEVVREPCKVSAVTRNAVPHQHQPAGPIEEDAATTARRRDERCCCGEADSDQRGPPASGAGSPEKPSTRSTTPSPSTSSAAAAAAAGLSRRAGGADGGRVQTRISTDLTPLHTAVISDSENTTASEFVSERIQTLVRAFSHRSQRVKERIAEPPTPSPSPPPEKREDYESRLRLDSFALVEDAPAESQAESEQLIRIACCSFPKKACLFPRTIDPQSKLYVSWQLAVSVCFLYNCWAIFLRAVFLEGTHTDEAGFFACDYLSDLVYLLDMLLFKARIKFHSAGMWVEDPKLTRRNYFRKFIFKMDVASLLPLDLLYYVYGVNPLLRLPRMLKIQTFWEFFDRIDALAKSPYVIRVLRTLLYMMYLIHLNTCAYYAISKYEGIGSNPFVFQGGNKTAYVRCFYFAFKTATSIGKNAKPSNELEYAYMTLSWLLGVFLFAFLIGQVRDIVATATQGRTQCRQAVDACVRHLRRLGLPDDLQRRVRLWLNHTWAQKKTLDENSILATLPRKMKTDIAISVHYNTLAKVQFFQDCERSMLRDLVLKLQSVLFLPGDYICRKGEIGVEMYIVNKGVINVIGGENNNVVLATLTEGSVFGEVSLLGLPGFNRRTADVLSVGFSNLFVLSKDDLNDVLHDYPDVEAMLRRKAKSQMMKNQASNEKTLESKARRIHAEPIIKTPPARPKTPKLVQTVLQVLRPESKTGSALARRMFGGLTSQRPTSGSESDSSSDSSEAMGRPTTLSFRDEDGVEMRVDTYHDVTQNALTLRATSASGLRVPRSVPPRCKSSPAVMRHVEERRSERATPPARRPRPSPLRLLGRCLGADSPESAGRRHWRPLTARSRVTPLTPPAPHDLAAEGPPADEASATLRHSGGSAPSSRASLRSASLSGNELSDRDEFRLVSPGFPSSSSPSWNFEEPPC
ncbi:cyclic nucleotide-gated ion channel subunit B [Amblyomma americanum]